MTDPVKAFDLAEVIPLALVIALSPLSIIPGILVLHTPRPRPTSLAFLAGWVLGIGALRPDRHRPRSDLLGPLPLADP